MQKLLFFTLILISINLNAKTYYIKSTGNNNNTGLSDAQAWATVTKINGTYFKAGDSILFNRGDIWREQLTIPSSGTFEKLIVFSAYGVGNDPILSPAILVKLWSVDTENYYYKSGYKVSPLTVSRNGQLLEEFDKKSDLATNKSGWYYDPTYDRVYLGKDPTSDNIEINVDILYAITTNGKDYLYFDNLDIRGAWTGFHVAENSNDIFFSCKIRNVGNGFECSSYSTGNIEINGATIEYTYDKGVAMTVDKGEGYSIKNCIIRYCGVYCETLPIYIPSAIYARTNKTLIENNIFPIMPWHMEKILLLTIGDILVMAYILRVVLL
jgi:hypothetical protein